MAFLEKQKRGNNFYYYMTKTIRVSGKKFKKLRHYVGHFDNEINKKDEVVLINKNRSEFEKLLKKNNVVDEFTDFDIEIFFDSEEIYNEEDIKEINSIKKEYLKILNKTDEAYLDHITTEFIIRHSYDTNKAEGNTFTYEETRALLEKNQILKPHSKREINEITNIREAFNFMRNYSKKLTPIFIKKLHAIVTFETLKYPYLEGKFRPKGVSVYMGGSSYKTVSGGRNVTSAINSLIKEFDKNYEKEKFGSIVRFYSGFLAVHPFLDGNGRSSRMLLSWLLMKEGLPPVNFDADKHLEHIECLESSRSMKSHVPLGQFILNRIRQHSWK
jgi:Fic family protein